MNLIKYNEEKRVINKKEKEKGNYRVQQRSMLATTAVVKTM
jgi:hypothetical protein